MAATAHRKPNSLFASKSFNQLLALHLQLGRAWAPGAYAERGVCALALALAPHSADHVEKVVLNPHRHPRSACSKRLVVPLHAPQH